jgi:two-component system sensor histidine kinase RcsD
MQNIGDAFKQPLKTLATQAAAFNTLKATSLPARPTHWFEWLMKSSWRTCWRMTAGKEATLFSIQDLIDEVVPEVLPVIKRKGLQLLINNRCRPMTNATAIAKRCAAFC